MRIDIRDLIELPSKKILVVCSHSKGRDFNNSLNDSLKLLFGDNPEYTFCFSIVEDGNRTACRFPEGILDNNNYDAIWFAGCNMSHWIFNNPETSIGKIKQILNPDGFITFTESVGYVKLYKGENNLTLSLNTLGLKSTQIEPNKTELITKINDLFDKNFEPIIIDNHLLFKIKMSGEKVRKHRKHKKRSKIFKNPKKNKNKRTIKK